MITSERKAIFDYSKSIATELYRQIEKVKSSKGFGLIRTSLIENGLALTISNSLYDGHIFITEENFHRKILFIPHERNPLYLKRSIAYIEIFKQLFNPGE